MEKEKAYKVIMADWGVTKHEAIELLTARGCDEDSARHIVVKLGETKDGSRNSAVWEWPGDNVFLISAGYEIIITQDKPDLERERG